MRGLDCVKGMALEGDFLHAAGNIGDVDREGVGVVVDGFVGDIGGVDRDGVGVVIDGFVGDIGGVDRDGGGGRGPLEATTTRAAATWTVGRSSGACSDGESGGCPS